ncbi:MAG: cell division protein FtsA [Clostridia bacterium]|nr:cell division protein FtsA [Clostridia bacterium]
MNEYIAVMDIGTTGVRLLVAKVGTNGKPHIVARDYSVCHGIRKFKIENAAEVTESIRKVLRRIREKTEIIVRSAYVSISGAHVKYVKNVDSINIAPVYSEDGDFGPGTEPGVVTGNDVAALLDKVEGTELYDNEYLLGAVPIRFTLDDGLQTTSPIGIKASNLRVDAQLLIAENTYVEAVSECVRAAGLEIDGFIPLSVAVRALLTACPDPDASTLFIDMGGFATEFCVFYKGNIYYASALPVGGGTITGDIAQVLNVRREEAELLKCDYQIADASLVTNDVDVAIGSLADGKSRVVKCSEIVGIMQARIEDIFGIIRERLDVDEIDTSFIDRVVLSGDGIVGFSGLDIVCERVFRTKLADIDFTRNTAMKAIFTYTSGMIMYIASMLPYGMKRSDIEREEPEGAQEDNKPGVFGSIKDKFRNLIGKLRD